MYDLVLVSGNNLMKFNRIKTLVIDNIEAKYLQNLLNQLFSLSPLSLLVIRSIDSIKNRNTIYR